MNNDAGKYKKIFLILTLTLLLTSSLFNSIVIIKASNNNNNDFIHDINQSNLNNKTILITGFKPFHIYPINPSEIIVEELNGSSINNYTIIGKVLPIDFEIAPYIVRQAIEEYQPSMIINLGLAPNETTIRLETLAINIQYDPYVDNPFQTLKKVKDNGPILLKSNLDIRRSYSALKEENIPVKITYSAGWYLCNTVFYDTMYYLKNRDMDTPAGFIHLPNFSDDFSKGLPKDLIIDAIELIIIESFE